MIIFKVKDKENKEIAFGLIFPWDKTICAVCGSIVPKGNYCDKCGSSLIITRFRQEDDNTRKGDRTPHAAITFSFHFIIHREKLKND